MKKIVILALAISMVASFAFAQEGAESKSTAFGARVGYSFSPDQFYVGAQADFGHVFGPGRLVPNFEIGFGDSFTTMCFNGDYLYDFEGTPWTVGGEIGVIHSSWDDGGLSDIPGFDFDTSSTDIGLSVLGNYNLEMSNGKTLVLEAKLGLANSPDFKLGAGYYFF